MSGHVADRAEALLIGLLVAEVIQPGRGMKAVPRPGGAGGRVEAVWERCGSQRAPDQRVSTWLVRSCLA